MHDQLITVDRQKVASPSPPVCLKQSNKSRTMGKVTFSHRRKYGEAGVLIDVLRETNIISVPLFPRPQVA